MSLFHQAVLVYEILNYIETPEGSTVTGVGLCLALFTSEFCKAFFISLLWAINLRTAVRLKGAFSTMAYQKVISLRVHSSISMGEVNVDVLSGFTKYSALQLDAAIVEMIVLHISHSGPSY